MKLSLWGCLPALLLAALGAQFLGAQTLSQSTDPNTITAGNSIGCVNGLGQHADNSFYRAYSITTNAVITAVRFGVEEDSGNQNPLTFRIHSTSVMTGTPTLASLTTLNTTTVRSPGNGTWNATTQTLNLSQPVSITTGQRIVVELFMPNNQTAGGSFFIGSNAAGQSAPSYFQSTPCGLAAITDLAAVGSGYPNMHIILDLVTVLPGMAPNPEIDVQYPNRGSAGTIPSGTMNVWGGCFAGGTTGNVMFTIANQGASTALAITTVTTSAAANCTPQTPTFGTSVAAGGTTTLTVPVQLAAGTGSFGFTVTINNSDANEGVYTIGVVGGRGLTGTVTVQASGGTYTDLGQAFNDMEDFGIAGNLIIEIASGTYTPTTAWELGSDFSLGSNFDEVPTSNPANTVTIRAATGATVNIQGPATQIVFEGIAGLESGCMSIVGVSNLTIERLNFIGGAGAAGFGLAVGSRPASAQQATGLTVRQCSFRSIVNGAGLWIVGDGTPFNTISVENCSIHSCGAGNTIYGSNAMPGALSFFMPGTGVVVQHCSVTNNAGLLTTMSAQQGNPGAVGWRGSKAFMAPPTLNFNVFTSSTSAFPVYHFAGTTTTTPTAPEFPTTCDRNVYFLSNGASFAVESATTPVVRADFTAWRTQYGGLDANSVNSDPLFLSATDLHINTGSPALDLATTSTVNVDIDGDSRPVGAARDAGSDERTGAAPTPSLTIVATDSAAAEATPATQTGTYTVTASSAPASALTVNITMSGTAAIASGTDYNLSGSTINYTTGPTGTFTFPSGVTTTTITLTPVDDAAMESSETAIMTLNSGTGYTVGAPNSGTVNIADNDTTGTPAVSVAATDNAAAEATPATQTGTFTITLSPVSATPVTLNFTMSGTASTTPGTDYNLSGTGVTWTGPGGTIAVAATTASVTVTLTPVDDTSMESSETAILTVNTGTGYTVGAPANDTVNIADNDTVAGLTITTATLPNGSVGTAYNATITSTGGTGPFTWSLSAGALPGGLVLNTASTASTTTLSGTPTAAGTFNFTVQVTDSTSASDTQSYTVTISTGGGGGGPIGGGGGGGCASSGDFAPLLLLAGLLAVLAVFARRRFARQ